MDEEQIRQALAEHNAFIANLSGTHILLPPALARSNPGLISFRQSGADVFEAVADNTYPEGIRGGLFFVDEPSANKFAKDFKLLPMLEDGRSLSQSELAGILATRLNTVEDFEPNFVRGPDTTIKWP